MGFFTLENHGIPTESIEEVYRISKLIFDLTNTTKMKYENCPDSFNRGYHRFGKEHAKDNPNPDLKEFWQVGREINTTNTPKNVWPDEVPEAKLVLMEYYKYMEQLGQELLKASALYLDLEEYFFSDMVFDSPTILRLIHYPPILNNASCPSVRAAAHEDINLITLLSASTQPGLEIKDRSGNWLPIHTEPEHIVVDCGDMIQNITNGFFKSTTHRVVNPSNSREERFSIPFFVPPKDETDLSPLPSLVKDKKSPYISISAKEYLANRLKEIGIKS